MDEKKLLRELDRNMDHAYDSLFVLNAAVDAIIRALPAEAAGSVMQSLDAVLQEVAADANPPGEPSRTVLQGWRNAAARRAGFPPL